MQRRFGLSADGGVASIGTGVMEDLWHGAAYTLPFLYVGTWRCIMFPERGRNVPFTIGDGDSMHTWSGANSEAGSWTTWGPISTWRSISMCR
jgi:hypothetical protein